MTYILGINSVYHESSVCLLKNGKVLAFIEEERLNRIKHAKPALITNPDELPLEAIEYCLKTAGITFGDIGIIGFSIDPEQRYSKNINSDPHAGSKHIICGSEKGERFFRDKTLNVIPKLSSLFGRDISDIFFFIPHHTCHAFSTYIQSGFDDAAIVVIDGIGESAGTWVGVGKGNDVQCLYQIEYPNSIGFLWEKMSEFLGFDEYDAAKVMGLSSYGKTGDSNGRRLEQMKKIVRIHSDEKYSIDNSIMKFRTDDFSELEKLFGVMKRAPGSGITEDHKNIAGALQTVTDELVLNIANQAKKLTGSDRLCMSGGVSLNCVSNAAVIESGIFKNVYIEPTANDAGTAMGAAFYLWCHQLRKPRPAFQQTAFYGPEYDNEYIDKLLNKTDLEYQEEKKIEVPVAQLLAEGEIIPWFSGKMEIGPRALGHRSILADPRNPEIKESLNRQVKFREEFRPFCPSIMEEHVTQWFNLNGSKHLPLDYMLAAITVNPSKKHIIPAVVHVDGTARLQIVRKTACPNFWALINEFYHLTGIPMLLNTSFNIQEPIVCSPEDAIATFNKSDLTYMVMNNFLIKKTIRQTINEKKANTPNAE